MLLASFTLMEYLPSLSETTVLLVPFSETFTPATGSPLSSVIWPLISSSGKPVVFCLLQILCSAPEVGFLSFAHRAVHKKLCSAIRQSVHLALYQTSSSRFDFITVVYFFLNYQTL